MRLSLASALLLVGCANSGDEGMLVLNNTAVSGDSCSLSGDASQPFIPHGFINTDASVGYILTPLIQSRITATIGGGSGSAATPDPTTRTIVLRSADVKLTVETVEIISTDGAASAGGKATIPAFTVLTSGSIPPNGTVNTAFEVLTASQIRSIVAASGADVATQILHAEVLAEVTIKGTLGGDEVVSSPFNYPIQVCNDCVVVPACLEAENNPNPCNPYQDGAYCLSIITP